MTKRLYTAEKVLEAVLEDVDDDRDYNDPDEPIMEDLISFPTWSSMKTMLTFTNDHQTHHL